MKKILQIIPSLELGGTEAFVMNHYRVINRNEFQFDFLVFAEKDWPYLKEIEQLGGRVFYSSRPTMRNIYAFYKQFAEVVRNGGPYVAIHCHANEGNAIPLLCGLLCKIKIRISHSHSSTRSSLRSFRGWVCLLRKIIIRFTATRYLACSNEAGGVLYGRLFFNKHGKVVKNGICLEKYCVVRQEKIDSLRKEFGITYENDLIIGNISRFDRNKNQIFAIKVFEYLLMKHKNALLILGGVDGGELKKLQDYVIQHGLEKNVCFIGKRNDVEVCLKLLDVYLIPSISEGLPLSLLEAQASGCLCVVSTGVPDESNMELGSAFYLNLSDGAEHWAKLIGEKVANRIIPTQEDINKSFYQKGFDVVRSAEELVMYYELL